VKVAKVTQDHIPTEVSYVTQTLEGKGFEAYVVGGCIRDLLIGKKPKDWDVTTNATPEDIQAAFENTFYTNEFGTVGVVFDAAKDPTLKVIEVTPYRLEGKYSDARRPDSVVFSNSLTDDLKRRDFTINALAYNATSGELVDLYKGHEDLKAGLIRAVGAPSERFSEDALRMLRAIRIAAELDFVIEEETKAAIAENASLLAKISKERIRDEFARILLSQKPMKALILAQGLGILQYITPDLERGMGIEQNQAHSYDVWEHNLRSLQHAADKDWSLEIRLAALFHDVSKPETRRRSEEKNDWTFYGHDVVGGRLTRKILADLRFPKEVIEKVSSLVRWHMFFSDPDQVTLSAVRRIITNVGKENIWDLINLRICDRIGTGRPKEQPFRLRKYQSMIEEALRDPISVGMLKIDGQGIMELIGEKPSRRIGYILHALLEEVLDDPTRNTEEYLQRRAKELAALAPEELERLGEAGKEKKEEADEAEIAKLRKKHFVD
jgi:tRNA nucleotidyltransferase (CCA-adding enzyme)